MGGLRQLLRRQFTVSLTLIAALSISLFGQVKPKNSPTTMHVATHLVTVSAVATDKYGNPVTDLRANDFEVLDGNHPQKISFFATFTDQLSPPGRPLPSDTYTNVFGRTHSTPSSVMILLLDTLNSRKTSQDWGMEAVRRFLKQIQPANHLGIYVLGDDLKLVQDFTQDDSALVAALARYDVNGKNNAPGKSKDDNSEIARFLSGKDIRWRAANDSNMPGIEKRSLLDDNYLTTLTVLQLIARHLVGVPGRKTLVWISDNIPSALLADDLETYEQATGRRFGRFSGEIRGNIERMVRLFSENGIAVYPVDAKGLEAVDLNFIRGANAIPLRSSTEPVNDLLARTPEPDPAQLELARRTGGRAFYNRNDLETGIRRALDDSRFSYSLAYYPDHNKWKGEWRKIEVKVNQPNVTVLARRGYFALPDPRPIPPKSRIEFLSSIAASPLESAQLPFTVHITAMTEKSGPELDANVQLNPQSMLTYDKDGRWKGHFEVMFMQLDDKNKLFDATNKDVEADLNAKEYADLAQKGWTLNAQLKFMPKATLLCVILHDKSSDAVGSVRIPLARYSAALTAH